MIFFSSVLGFVLILTLFIGKKKRNSFPSIFFTSCIVLILSLLSGLRTKYNDTELYIYRFIYDIPGNISDFTASVNLSLGDNPGFYFYQFVIKAFISDDPQVFVFLSALITNIFFVIFYKRYSTAFTLSLFLYFTSGLFIFGMAAMKQMIAMAIGLWAISFFLKNKNRTFIVLILIASTIHPFVLLYFIIYFLDSKIWTKNVTFAILLAALSGLIFSQFVEQALVVAGSIGVNYEASYILEASGLNPLRLLIFSVVPVLSLIYKKQINASNNRILFISVNFSIISFAFMILASFGGANMFGRLANYFEPFIYISLPWILYHYVKRSYRLLYIALLIVGYSFFFYYQFVIVKGFNYQSVWF